MAMVSALGLTAAILFALGLARSHWAAPVALFSVTAPVVLALTLHEPLLQLMTYEITVLALYYIAFAIGRWTAPVLWRSP